MAKYNPKTIANLDNPPAVVSQINYNFTELRTLIDTLLSRDGVTPNTMQSILDMNNNRILNLPVPISPTEPARHGDIQQYVDQARAYAEDAEESAEEAEDSAEEAAADLAEFQSEYLGAFPEDPVLDKNGNPIKDGAFYYNSTDATIRVHSIRRVVQDLDDVFVSTYEVFVNMWIVLPVVDFVDLSDVDMDGAQSNDYLRWTGNQVIPVTPEAEHILQDNPFYDATNVQEALDDILIRTSLGIYDVSFWIEGLLGDEERMFSMVAARPFSLSVGAPESRAVARVAGIGSSVIRLMKNSVQFGTITFDPDETEGVFTVAADTDFVPGDIFEMLGPLSADTALRDVSVTMAFWR